MESKTAALTDAEYNAIHLLKDKVSKLEALTGIIEYRLYGVIPNSKDPKVNRFFMQTILNQRNEETRKRRQCEQPPTGEHKEAALLSDDDFITQRQYARIYNLFKK